MNLLPLPTPDAGPRSSRWGMRLMTGALCIAVLVPGLTGCAVLTVGGAVVGATISVAGAVVSTGVSVTGKVIEKTVDWVTPTPVEP